MKRVVSCLLLLSGLAFGQTEYVSVVEAPGWIAGICNVLPLGNVHRAAPSCPSTAKLEWEDKKQCIYRCVQKKRITKIVNSDSAPFIISGSPSIGWDSGSNYYDCSSRASGDGWKTIESAPRNGTVIETAQTYGIAATYGLHKYVNGSWQDAQDDHLGVMERCLYWRPTTQSVANYQDPTGGAQKSIKYWCDAMHVKYDAKEDICVQ